jgi:hypothetical protein
MRRRWYVLVALAAAGAVMLGVWLFLQQDGEERPPSGTAARVHAADQTEGPWVGIASCAAAGCHHGNGPKGTLGSEYTTWIMHDPHARAYESLLNPQSQRIIDNLRCKNPAPKHDRCLSCHVGPQWQEAKESPGFTLEDGVGCESCHGPAGRWLTEHYKSGWKQLSIAEKQQQGMADTKGLVGRATSCVGCHVGSERADVNHDLIAAGHPRLNFELAAFHALMPHHWDDGKDKRRYPDFEARAWAVGQLASAKAALDLLAHRAKEGQRDPDRQPWPEFAEYDCFACHHDLNAKSWRQEPDRFGKKGARRRLGMLPWGDWYFALVDQAVSGLEGNQDPKLGKEIARLKDVMERPNPIPEAVAETTAKIVAGHLRNGGEKAAGLLQARKLLHELGAEDPRKLAASWDTAAQHYLALAAVHSARSDPKAFQGAPPGELREALAALHGALRFPPNYDSPRCFNPGQFRQYWKRAANRAK